MQLREHCVLLRPTEDEALTSGLHEFGQLFEGDHQDPHIRSAAAMTIRARSEFSTSRGQRC